MVFVTGGIASGKRTFAATCGFTRERITTCTAPNDIPASEAVFDTQELVTGTETAAELEALADALARKEVVIATEIGLGVVPLDAKERAVREAAGRLACLLVKRADTVVRCCCGIPQALKGNLQPTDTEQH